MVEAIARIARVVDEPVTADIESGYAASLKDLGDSIRAVINAGAIGFNLEDATGDSAQPLFAVEQQTERIRAEPSRRHQRTHRCLPRQSWRACK